MNSNAPRRPPDRCAARRYRVIGCVLVRFDDGTSSTIRAENIVSVGEMDAQDTGANTEECIARVADGFMRMNSAQKLSEIATGVRRRSQTLLPARVRH